MFLFYKKTGIVRNKKFLNLNFEIIEHYVNVFCLCDQEEYEPDDELGKLKCDHSYHFQCIKQWLVHKNFCPVCKQEVVVRP